MKYLLLSALLISSVSFARTFDLSNRFGIGLDGGYTFPVHGNDFDDVAGNEMMWGAHLRYHFTAADSLLFNYSRLEFEDTDINANVMDLMYLNRINEGDKLTPILGIGAGVADMGNIGPYHDNMKFAAKARAGFEYAFTPDLFATVAVDYQFIGRMPGSGEDESDNLTSLPGNEIFAVIPQIGLTWFFGPDKEIGEDKKEEKKPDGDKDGVEDSLDKCPSTPPGSQVNEFGCLKGETITMKMNVLFPTGQSALDLESAPHLDKIAEFLKAHPDAKLEIQGHTDDTGSEKRNQALSQDRADAVKQFLVEHEGISPLQISSYGYGERSPVSSNATEEGRAENRRVMGIIKE